MKQSTLNSPKNTDNDIELQARLFNIMNSLQVDSFKKQNPNGMIESEQEFLKRLEKSKNKIMHKIDEVYKDMDKDEHV